MLPGTMMGPGAAAGISGSTPPGGSPAYVSVASSNAISTGYDVVVPVPLHSTGDLLICVIHPKVAGLVAPAGWTLVWSPSTKPAVNYWWKVASSSEPATYTWTLSKLDKQVVSAMVSISNAAYDTSGVTSSPSVLLTSIAAPNIVMSGSGILLAVCAAKKFITPPPGFTEIANLGTNPALSVAYKSAPAGATGTSTFTFASSKCEAAHISVI